MGKVDFHNDVLPLKDKVFRLVLRMTMDRTEAEDITQDTLVRAWERREEWQKIENMEAWLLTIARRLALDKLKVRSSKLKAESSMVNAQWSMVNGEIAIDEQLDLQQRVEAVRRMMDELPEVQRTIMELRDIEGLRYDEIATITDLSETQVKVYLHRARKKIRENL